MKTVLTIAGYDPSSGAGVTADLMVFAAYGLFGTSCITALTVQSTLGVESTHPVDSDIVGRTLECLDHDIRPSGIKIGMVVSRENYLAIARYLDNMNVQDEVLGVRRGVPIVFDPVMRSSSGFELADAAGVLAMRQQLLPLVSWITPNLQELALLSGETVERPDDLPSACHLLQQTTQNRQGRGGLGIFAKGGHLKKPDDYLLTPEGEGYWLPGDRVETKGTHGTGCALSSAFLSELVLGREPFEAAKRAKAYVAGALRTARAIGKGRGPVNHLWELSKVMD